MNILHELARRGWNDTVLLDRTRPIADSTWHAVGLVPVYSFGRLIAKSDAPPRTPRCLPVLCMIPACVIARLWSPRVE